MKHVTDFTNSQLHKLYSQVAQRNQLEQLITEVLPQPLRQQVYLCRFEQGELTLGYSLPEAGSSLRFYLPQLRTKIRHTKPFHHLKNVNIVALGVM